MKFNIATQGTDGVEFTSVDGRFVNLDGFADLRFFYYKDDKYYSVCELTTGQRIAGGFKLKDAKRHAIKLLEHMKTISNGYKIPGTIRSTVDRHGQANGG